MEAFGTMRGRSRSSLIGLLTLMLGRNVLSSWTVPYRAGGFLILKFLS